MSKNVINIVNVFMKNVIIGTERAMYRTFGAKQTSVILLKSPKSIEMCVKLIIIYFNKAYKALIYSTNGIHKREEDADPYFYSVFSKITEEKKHSYICALNILLALAVQFEQSLDRSKFNTKDLDAYTDSVYEQYEEIFISYTELIKKNFDHECNGIDISTCNPNEDLFHIGSV